MVAGLAPRVVERGVLALGVILFAVLAWVGVHLPVDYWDGYDYLANAQSLAAGDWRGYEFVRPPLLSVLLAPLAARHAPGDPGVAIHGVMVALAAATAGVTFRLLRRSVAPASAAIGVALLLLNPLFLHYAPFVMADVASMLFAALALLGWLRLREAGRIADVALLAFALAALVLTKYPAGLLGVALLIATALAPRRREGLIRVGAAGAAALAIFYLGHVAVFGVLFGGDARAWTYLGPVLKLGLAATSAAGTDPPYEYLLGLGKACTVPMLAVAGFGVVRAARRRGDGDLLHLVWAGVFLAAMTFVVSHKEARYLFPVLPSVLYFEALGLEGLLERVKQARLAAGLLAALLAWPAVSAAQELRRFSDPVYARPFMESAARWALARVQPGQPIVMLSPFGFSVYPKDPVWLADDEFFYFHTFGPRALTWFFGRPLIAPHQLPFAARPPGLPPPRGEALKIELFPVGGIAISTGLTRADTSMAARLPEPPPPLQLEHVDRRTYAKAEYEQLKATGAVPPGFHVFARRTKADLAEPIDGLPADVAPEVIELVKTEVARFSVR